MKIKDLLDTILRSAKDTSPSMAIYADCLREHMVKKHQDLLNEEVVID